MKKTIKKVLIANRAEIALRVIRTCREMGIATVSLYTEAEKDYPHALEADEAICMGSGPLSENYLNIDRIVKLAQDYKVDAVHPGYGFLSENAQFSEALAQAGIIFIGPTAHSMTLMGDKKASKVEMERFGIPQVPGYHGDSQEDDFLYKEAERIGFPLLIKASAGGGGKGMRIVEKLSDFHDALGTARREAMNAFGDDRVLLERYITSPRHIEVQVFSDLHGNHVHLYERECSIQRRYQKIVEETPSCALDDKLRLDICECAVKIASSISYLGAGTVEFILDTDGSYYFLEMNTRLQVEHPITEMLCGVDLVRWQIMVAEGREIPLAQKDIIPRGHALEVRIYAEDPGNGFMPSIGNITHRGDVEGSFVRLDAGYNTGNEVTVHFDPMLAKLIVWGETRDQALGRMKVALEQVPFMGLTTNRSYLGRVLEHPEFIAGNTYTHFVKTYEEDLAKDVSEEKMSKVLAAIFLGSEPATANRNSKVSSPWNRSDSWRNV